MEFSKELIEVFDYLGEKIGVVIDWTNDNVMTYLQDLLGRYVNYEIATSIVYILAGFLLLIVSTICWRKFGKVYEKCQKENDYDGCIIVALIGLIALAFAIYLIGSEVFDIIRCVYLPELQLYKYATSLIESQ